MKKYIKFLSLIILTITLFASCNKSSELLVFDSQNGQTLIKLASNSGTAPTPQVGVTTTEIKVLVSTKSSTARDIKIAIVDSLTTATPDQYTISGLTIPANSFVGTITITSNYDALPVDGSTYLDFNVVSVGSSKLAEDNNYRLEFFRKCPIVLADFVGTWSGTGSWSEIFGYTTEVVTTLDSNGDLWMNGLLFQWVQGWWGEVIVTNTPVKVDINVDTEELVIAEQPYITTTWNGSPQPAYNLKATGKVLNACQKTMVVFPVLIQGGSPYNGANFGGPLFKETIKLNNPT